MDFTGRKQDKQMKLANREQANFCLIVGENELAANTVMLKNLASGEQSSIARMEIVEKLKSIK